MPPPAHSATQDLFDLSPEELMHVEVKVASKYWQQPDELPERMTIFTRHDIARYGYSSLVDILKNMPGLFMVDDTENFLVGSYGNIDGGILFLVNNVSQHPSLQKSLTPSENSRLNIPLEAIDRIELIHGPKSVIYGNAAFQGVINIVTDEADTQGSTVAAGIGTNANSKLFARAASRFDNGYFVMNAGRSKAGGYDAELADMMSRQQLDQLTAYNDTSLDGNTEHELSSLDSSLQLGGFSAKLRYNRSDFGIYAASPPLLADDNTIKLSTWHGALDYEFKLAANITSHTSLIYSTEKYDLDNLNLFTPDTQGYQLQTSTRWDLEQLVTILPRQGWELMVGYRYRSISDVENESELLLPPDTYLINERVTLDSIYTNELFTQWVQSIGKKWKATAGFRLLWLPDEYQFQTSLGSPATDAEASLVNEDETLLTYRLSLQYHLNDHQSVTLIQAKAAQDRAGAQFAEPEVIITTEFNYNILYDNWLLTSSAYYNRISNLVRRNLRFENGDFISSITNDGVWNTVGVEASGEYRITTNWRAGGSISWQSTEDENNNMEIGYSPQWLAKIRTSYRHQNMTYSVYGYYVGKMLTDANQTDSDNDGIPDQTIRLGDAVAGYWNWAVNLRYQANDHFYGTLNISNVFDKEYRYAANKVSDLERGLIANGRQALLTIGWEF